MADATSITIPAAVVQSLAARFSSLEALVLSVRAALEAGDDHTKRLAPDGLVLVAEEIGRIACDLDVSAWSDLRRNREIDVVPVRIVAVSRRACEVAS